MAVSNGQSGNATTFNNAFISRTVDSGTVGKVGLANTAPESGATVSNAQQSINELADAVGMSDNADATTATTYANENVITTGDTHKEALEALDATFDPTTGHAHDGVDSPQIDADNLDNFNGYFMAMQTFTKATVNGFNVNVDADMVGKTSGGAFGVPGVVTDAPNNLVLIRSSTGNLFLEDGYAIYGRITYSAGTWSIAFYKGADVSLTSPLVASNVVFYFNEVFAQGSRPTIPQHMQPEVKQPWMSIPYATPTVPGILSTSSQSIAGDKTFTGHFTAGHGLRLASETNNSSGSLVTISPTKSVVVLNNASLVSVEGITATPVENAVHILVNETTVDVTIKNLSGTAANQIKTGTGADFTMLNNSAIFLVYEYSDQKWYMIGGGGGTAIDLSAVDQSILPDTDSTWDIGSATFKWANIFVDLLHVAQAAYYTSIGADPSTPPAGLSLWYTKNKFPFFINEDGSVVDLARPQTEEYTFSGTTITLVDKTSTLFVYNGGSSQTLGTITGTKAVGDVITVMGSSDTNTITIDNNDVSSGWLLNGSAVLGRGQSIRLQWSSTLVRWVEVSRNA